MKKIFYSFLKSFKLFSTHDSEKLRSKKEESLQLLAFLQWLAGDSIMMLSFCPQSSHLGRQKGHFSALWCPSFKQQQVDAPKHKLVTSAKNPEGFLPPHNTNTYIQTCGWYQKMYSQLTWCNKIRHRKTLWK